MRQVSAAVRLGTTRNECTSSCVWKPTTIVVTEVAYQLRVIRQKPKHLHARKRRVQEKSDGPFEARAGAESAPSG